MRRDRTEIALTIALILCTLAQAIIAIWTLANGDFRFDRFTG